VARYAESTSVPSDRSRAEIERTLERYGASKFMYGWDEDAAVIAFSAHDRFIRFRLPMPSKADERFTTTPTGRRRRDSDAALKAWEQAVRQSWRALALVIKAKLEAVEAEISEFEDEFLAYIVMPDGKTVSQHVRPEIEHAYEIGEAPKLMLPSGGETS
jgi:acyl-CoA reductase-like NAD-dependent aldehyde dehydrogenase